MLNPMSLRPPSRHCAPFVENDSVVHESGTDISNHTSRIRFIAHSRIVPGRAVVDAT
jgi:hypothetical protein